MEANEVAVTHNPAKKRFEVSHEGHTAVVDYIPTKDSLVFTHTEVPKSWEGKGIASKMAHEALTYAKSEGLKVMPLCPYVASYIRRHPEYRSLLAPGFHV